MIAKGQKISDRYQIIKTIGEGGMANVYLAKDTILERNVAVKILRGDLSLDEKFVRRFQREALQASSLNDKNIVEVYDVGEDHGDYYIVMEYIEGKHLKNLLKRRGKLTVNEVVDILLQVTSGLSVAHDSYIIHRDIKPQNIMILENGIVKLTDFGISVAMNSTQLTQTNSVMGSVHYLPPEQASGKGATLQSDIYSLGILMYELLTGKLPFKGDNAVEIALKQLKEPMPLIKDEILNIPQSICNIIKRATAKNPKNRYADAREMHEDLLTCLEDSRKNEEEIEYTYPEKERDDSKIMKTLKDTKLSKAESDELIAKKMAEGTIKSQNKTLVILFSVFTSIVVLITTIVVLLPYINKSNNKYIPDVEGMSEKKAVKKLQDEGFEIKDRIVEPSEDIEKGSITRTTPSANSKVKKGADVTIYISSGTNSIEIEDYTGKNFYEVKGMLEAFGISVTVEEEEIEKDSGKEYHENEIVRQSVEKGELLTKGDIITLYIATVTNVYPDFTDGTYKVIDILDFCNQYKVMVTFKDNGGNDLEINNNNATNYNNNAILSQSRAAGSEIPKSGGNLTIKIDFSGGGSEEYNDLDT
ncbi:MAG: Stk1 family PASTA domain-containing Ser/Thr kinase [Mollicutes bacterium]|nr:Stk1 family PASTA domain-containing Ser/Thr kinase [Mollicutes bacterium]